DPAFDLDKHLIRVSLPSPGGMRELCDFVGGFAGTRLERDRPLWKAVLVEGLEGGKLALVMKIHHAAMDGGKSAAIAGELMDTSPEGRVIPPPEEPWLPDREPTIPWLAADTLRTLAGKPRRAVEAATKMVEATRNKGQSQPAPAADTEVSEKPPLFEAPPTMFNGALTPHRSVALADVSFDEVKAIKRAFGTTVNDVVLASCCAALRSWLEAHGGLPDRPLIATVPVSVRHEGDQAGNRVSVIRVHLPVQSDDPVERLLAINEETTRQKRRHGRSGGGDLLKNFADLVTNITVPWMATHFMDFFSSRHLADRVPPLWNLVISNVAGPPVPLYTAGTRLTHLFPLGPVQQGSGLNITVMSAVDRLCFGALACSELVPDLQNIADGFVREIELLKERIE
ncbi:MAG: wax ester/triacylglycerol synthase family O-acyltransferase, partial [Myxococcales bacterium]|nr:wax ester/triacylglycerol synthase family O-acyltransferase [Deltaproteobacteria bacterium]NNL22953.1 wax ester/triacylglycerol synthase family O-acyltransferase [Myxococcales bacterium]